MGRIAEALRKAQQERSRRLQEKPTGNAESAVACEDTSSRSVDRSDRLAHERDVLGQATVLEASPRPEPFVVNSAPLLPENIHPSVVAFHVPRSAVAEKYRLARTRLLTSNPNGSSRVFAITSSLPKEGKTVTTANLGFSLAELRHLRVAIFDFDFRRHGLSRLCQVSQRPGVADVLRGEKKLAEVCLPVVRSNLHVIPTGDCGDTNPSEWLASDRMPALMKEIGERFHYTLIDTPPVSTCADIGLIAPRCHSAVLVVRIGSTPEPLLARCAQMLQENQVPIVGTILSGYCDETRVHDEEKDYCAATT